VTHPSFERIEEIFLNGPSTPSSKILQNSIGSFQQEEKTLSCQHLLRPTQRDPQAKAMSTTHCRPTILVLFYFI
jgi:hypothetical protein